MFLNDVERSALDSLRLKIKNGKIASSSINAASDFLDCGFDVYIDIDNGTTFEKIGDELIPQDSLETKAEKRFITRNLKK